MRNWSLETWEFGLYLLPLSTFLCICFICAFIIYHCQIALPHFSACSQLPDVIASVQSQSPPQVLSHGFFLFLVPFLLLYSSAAFGQWGTLGGPHGLRWQGWFSGSLFLCPDSQPCPAAKKGIVARKVLSKPQKPQNGVRSRQTESVEVFLPEANKSSVGHFQRLFTLPDLDAKGTSLFPGWHQISSSLSRGWRRERVSKKIIVRLCFYID